jgi:hypothetical protein
MALVTNGVPAHLIFRSVVLYQHCVIYQAESSSICAQSKPPRNRRMPPVAMVPSITTVSQNIELPVKWKASGGHVGDYIRRKISCQRRWRIISTSRASEIRVSIEKSENIGGIR